MGETHENAYMKCNFFKQNILGLQDNIIKIIIITYHDDYHCYHNCKDCKHRGGLDLDTTIRKAVI